MKTDTLGAVSIIAAIVLLFALSWAKNKGNEELKQKHHEQTKRKEAIH